MLRREAISLLLGQAAIAASRTSGNLDRFLNPDDGCALLFDIRNRRIVAANNSPVSGSVLVAPGSTLKPFTLAALAAAGRLGPDTAFPCPGRLTLGGRRLDCSHPPMASPIRIETSLAYSCNCFVAHVAQRFQPGDLARALRADGFGAVRPAMDPDRQELQSLGEANIQVTPLELVRAYWQLALHLKHPGILAGMEGAVEYGTAQLARVRWATLAGKTGSTRLGGQFIAWFAGFVPSRAPEVAIAVMLAGRHGGSDAAPVAAQILDAWHAGRV
jgi:cell division protein FtsI/penicillin-binding protein 2